MTSGNTDPNSLPEKDLSPAQLAAQLTWQLKGDLKNAQISRLRVAKMMARIRDEKRYVDLGYKDMESYAAERLRLSRPSLYRYLRVYDWVKVHSPAWLEPHPKGFIPELSDIVDLAWIEKELTNEDLTPARKKELVKLRKKAQDGELVQKDLGAIRRRTRKPGKSFRSFLKALRVLLRRAAELTKMPSEVIEHLEAAVGILENHEALDVAGMEILEEGPMNGGDADFA